MFTAGRILRSANRPNLHRPSCSSPSGGQSLGDASDKVHLHLYKLPSANYHVYRQQQLELEKERKSQDKTHQEPQKKQQQQQPFYVPFIWQALLATVMGIVVIAIGITLCVLGYEAENRHLSKQSSKQAGEQQTLRTSKQPNKTQIAPHPTAFPSREGDGEASGNFSSSLLPPLPPPSPPSPPSTSPPPAHSVEQKEEDFRLRYLIYIGPVVMSCGSFAIVFSCVVVCETRDRVLQLLDRRQKQLERLVANGNRQDLMRNLEEHLMSSTVSLASDNNNTSTILRSNNNNDLEQHQHHQQQQQQQQQSICFNEGRRSSFNALHKLKIDVFTKSLIKSQLRDKLTALIDAKLET